MQHPGARVLDVAGGSDERDRRGTRELGEPPYRDRRRGPVHDDARLPRIGRGLVAWIMPSLIGILLLEIPGVPTVLTQSAQLVVLVLSVVLYALTYRLSGPARPDVAASRGEAEPSIVS